MLLLLLLLLLLVRCRYGVTGRLQTAKIGMLSEGQKSRLIFAMMCMKVWRTACAGLHCLRQGLGHMPLRSLRSLLSSRTMQQSPCLVCVWVLCELVARSCMLCLLSQSTAVSS